MQQQGHVLRLWVQKQKRIQWIERRHATHITQQTNIRDRWKDKTHMHTNWQSDWFEYQWEEFLSQRLLVFYSTYLHFVVVSVVYTPSCSMTTWTMRGGCSETLRDRMRRCLSVRQSFQELLSYTLFSFSVSRLFSQSICTHSGIDMRRERAMWEFDSCAWGDELLSPLSGWTVRTVLLSRVTSVKEESKEEERERYLSALCSPNFSSQHW